MFLNNHLDVRTIDGRKDTLLHPLTYKDSLGRLWRAKKYSFTDGLSIPSFISWIPGFAPNGDDDWWSGVLHDAFYHGTAQIKEGKHWVDYTAPKRVADWVLRDALKSQGVGCLRRNLIYYAVRLFGWSSYRPD